MNFSVNHGGITMKYDFTSIPDRRGTGSTKWDEMRGASPDRVPLSVADMEFYTAPPIRKALAKLSEEMVLGYTKPNDAYFEAVKGWMKRRHNFDVKKEWIIQTPGVIHALGLLIDAATKPEDSVLVLSPVYYPFDNAIVAKGRKIVYSNLINNDGRYEIDFADLESKLKRKDVTAILFSSPHNPIGRVWETDELLKAAQLCCDNDVFIISDEIHNDLIMPGFKHTVMATLSDEIRLNCAVCTAPSKTFNLAGVQCSNIIIPNDEIRRRANNHAVLGMHSMLNIFTYTACIAAYNECEDWLEELIDVIRQNADTVEKYMAANFPQIKVSPLEGTYLQWLDLRGTGLNHVEQKLMFEDAGLWFDGGEMFGVTGRGFQRINLACCAETLEKSLERFGAALSAELEKRARDGSPVHITVKEGDVLDGFVYNCAQGEVNLKDVLSKKTVIFFSRNLSCPLCRDDLDRLSVQYAEMQANGYDLKVVVQSSADDVAKEQANYPFELICDEDFTLYDRYNVFAADSTTRLVAGDAMFEKKYKASLARIMDSDELGRIFSYGVSEDYAERRRQLQLCATFVVDENAKVISASYGKTIGERFCMAAGAADHTAKQL